MLAPRQESHREQELVHCEDAGAPAQIARAHSATLLAGEQHAGHGPVRVWSPVRTIVIRRTLEVIGLIIIPPTLSHIPVFVSWFAALVALVLTNFAVGPAVWIIIAICFGASQILGYFVGRRIGALTALLRPCYVTSDDSGLAVTSWRGASAIRWADVAACRMVAGEEIYLYLSSGKKLYINLSGYRKQDVGMLSALIIERAELRRSRGWPSKLLSPWMSSFVRPGYHQRLLGVALDRASAVPAGQGQ